MADKESRPRHDGNPPDTPDGKPKRRGGLRILLAILLIGAVVLAGVAGGAYWAFYERGSVESDTTVIIEEGSGLLALSEKLEQAGVVPNGTAFGLAVRLAGAGRDLQAGEYAFEAGMTMFDVMDKMRRGDTVVRRLTIPEGLTSKEIVALLRTESALRGEVSEVPEEGSLLPETYHFHWGDGRAAMISRMQEAMREALERLWPARQEGLPVDAPEDARILASIVEKETAVASERPHIAGVFVNRLKRGMALQSDPTVVYGITGGNPLGRPLTRSELDRQTPYNTYHFRGLPPTPIANPGLESLKAVLDPMKTNDLYFVADGTGGHAFAETYSEHQANVRKWRRIEAQQAQ